VDEAGMGVSVSSLELAFWVNASPNHRLALNHWYATNSLELPVYDYATLAITLAVETDQRLCLSWEPEDSTDDTVIEILDNTAELWYLSPETIVGVDDAGALQTIGSKPQIIRNDADKLAMTMAGTIARYYYSRCRAELVFKDLVAYTGLLGQVLNAVDAGGAINDVQAPITAVEWTYGEEVKTTVKTGYAK
jgi:hypothetical protein